jgi:endonuclease-3
MTRGERYQFVLDYFSTHNPDAETELLYDSPYQLLVAVVLSAQCTDKRVNMTTPAIFERYPDAYALAKAGFDDLFPLIKSISYPNNKTRHLIGMARMLVEKFHGEVPLSVDELIELPGVGRKTANVITSVVDNQPNMAVDTHVFRVSARIGLTVNAKTPLAAEKQLLEFIPTEQVHIAHHWLILHGRYICVARTPKCPECGLQQACKYFAKHYGASAAEMPGDAGALKLPVLKLAGAGAAASSATRPIKTRVVKKNVPARATKVAKKGRTTKTGTASATKAGRR